MSEAGLDPAALVSTQIDTYEKAERAGFVGSPTIRVDGRDIQPPAEPEAPGLCCRVYHLRDGRVSPLPDPDDVNLDELDKRRHQTRELLRIEERELEAGGLN